MKLIKSRYIRQRELRLLRQIEASGDWKLSWDAGTGHGSVASASEGNARWEDQ